MGATLFVCCNLIFGAGSAAGLGVLEGMEATGVWAISTSSFASGTRTTASNYGSSGRRRLRGLADKETDTGSTENEEENDPSTTNENNNNTKNSTNGVEGQATTRGQVDLINLVPFDVQIAVTENLGIQTHEVNNIVTNWMNRAFNEQLAAFGFTQANLFAVFDSVILFENGNEESNINNRELQQQQKGELFTAKFRAGAVLTRDDVNNRPVPENDILLIQQMTLLNDTSLKFLLQSSSALGLGSAVVDVNAFLTPNSKDSSEAAPDDASDSVEFDFEIVIVVAIAVAGVAFMFLIGAVIWAYRYDRSNREAFLVRENNLEKLDGLIMPSSPERTNSDTANNDDESPERIRAIHVERSDSLPNVMHPLGGNLMLQQHPPHSYPTIIGGEENDIGYPESVISDSIISGSVMSGDISTSLSQYYRAGMGKASNADYGLGGGLLSDAGSVSSMESYGYSLDNMDGGVSAVVPTSDHPVPYKKGRGERIGGLPVEPDNLDDENNYDTALMMDDVQIPDLDKELANLDIQLTPNMEHIMDVESFSQHDLEKYQMQDLEEMEALEAQRPSQLAALGVLPRTTPVDVDDPAGGSVDDDDDDIYNDEDNDEKEVEEKLGDNVDEKKEHDEDDLKHSQSIDP